MARHPIQMTQEMIETGALAAALYRARQDRLVHPEGSFDNASCWYPSNDENSDGYTSGKFKPTRTFGNGYNKAARSKDHVVGLAVANPEFFKRVALAAMAAVGDRLTTRERNLGAGWILRDLRAYHDVKVMFAAEKAAAEAKAAAKAEAEAEAKAAVERDEDAPFLADIAA